jgi:hypothetical protein
VAISDLRMTVLEIVNEVQRRIGVNTTTTLTATSQARVLLQLLNKVMDRLSDYGDWHEMYDEVTINASSSVGTYTVSAGNDQLVKNIYEVQFGVDSSADIAPLEVRDIQEIRRLQRVRSWGRPRNFAVVGVASATGNPRIRVHPVPATAENNVQFNVAIFIKPPLYTTNDTTEEPPFPAQLLIQGLYAEALLDENGGESTREYEMAFALFERMTSEAINRFNADTGTDLFIVPTGRF